MATFNQEGQNVNMQINTSDQPEKTHTMIRMHLNSAKKLREISAIRKSNGDLVKSAQGIVEQLINQAHKREVK
jgi:hypothetical protein